ncbi:MAG: phosphate ABC transporter permease subunit PstC, partial [Planctomycetales bacterium]|nr:phosphate ABC transporter permease subunit PstC [Planctomycetales bacterium]
MAQAAKSLGSSTGSLVRAERDRRALVEGVIRWVLWSCAGVSILTTLGIVLVLMVESLKFFSEVSVIEFLTATEWSPLFRDKHYGILPLFCGTLLVTAGAVVIATPIGLGAAIYLSEYASPALRETVKPVLEVLAGIPSVVYGVVAVTTVSPIIKTVFHTEGIFSALSASIVVGFMILPMIVSLSEDVLRSVPRALREAAFALGATKYDVTVKVIVPAALSGIVASVLLAVSRAIGETMAVTLAAGAQPNLTLNPLDSVQTMTAYIV